MRSRGTCSRPTRIGWRRSHRCSWTGWPRRLACRRHRSTTSGRPTSSRPPASSSSVSRPMTWSGWGRAVGSSSGSGWSRPAVGSRPRHSTTPSAWLRAWPRRRSTERSFVDDSLLELVCVADPVAVRALRRKYFGELDPLPENQRAVLVETLRQWLLQWGHRPGITQALTVHPQTVSGRLHLLHDLLADDLEDAVVRAELLVLLTAEGPPDRRPLLCSPCQESDNRGGLPGPGCEPVSSRRRVACGCASTRRDPR